MPFWPVASVVSAAERVTFIQTQKGDKMQKLPTIRAGDAFAYVASFTGLADFTGYTLAARIGRDKNSELGAWSSDLTIAWDNAVTGVAVVTAVDSSDWPTGETLVMQIILTTPGGGDLSSPEVGISIEERV